MSIKLRWYARPAGDGEAIIVDGSGIIVATMKGYECVSHAVSVARMWNESTAAASAQPDKETVKPDVYARSVRGNVAIIFDSAGVTVATFRGPGHESRSLSVVRFLNNTIEDDAAQQDKGPEPEAAVKRPSGSPCTCDRCLGVEEPEPEAKKPNRSVILYSRDGYQVDLSNGDGGLWLSVRCPGSAPSFQPLLSEGGLEELAEHFGL